MGRGQWQVIVTEIPYQVQKSKLIERLADLVNTKKVPILADIRDKRDLSDDTKGKIKAALDAFTDIAATELLSDHVTFTNIHMPLVRTPMIAPTKIYDKFPTISPAQAADTTQDSSWGCGGMCRTG